jgi:hypothetical protein
MVLAVESVGVRGEQGSYVWTENYNYSDAAARICVILMLMVRII